MFHILSYFKDMEGKSTAAKIGMSFVYLQCFFALLTIWLVKVSKIFALPFFLYKVTSEVMDI